MKKEKKKKNHNNPINQYSDTHDEKPNQNKKLGLIVQAVFLLIGLSIINPLFSQQLTQRIKGKVFDSESQTALMAVNVAILGTNPVIGTTTDENGNFSIEKVPIGRYKIEVSSVGYNSTIVSEVLITTGKETVLEISLKQSINQLDEVLIKSHSKKELPLNSMATISARSFTVEETRRYAGGLDDPARMASAFSGVTVGNLQDNAIVIRGNAPKGLSWRLEGVEIPNPNHYAGGNVAGGGAVTIFSSQLLANSDFFTGAFPAEYGNALAGVFDMKFRCGNVDKREHTVQVGMMGIDLSSEGPFVKGKRASYLFNYRYSTLGLLSKLKLIPSEQIPIYQDLSFKLNFPTQNAGAFSLWGIGALDQNNEPHSLDSANWKDDWDRINYEWKINTGALGISHKYIFGKQTYINSTFAISGTKNKMDQQRVDDELQLRQDAYFEDKSGKATINTFINHKFNAHHTIRMGLTHSQLFYCLDLNGTINNQPDTYQNFVKEDGSSGFSEFYVQSKYDFSEKISANIGLNASYFSLNQNYSIDPRFGIKWNFAPGQTISFGYGKHSQLEELRMYMIRKNADGNTLYPNKNLGLSQAQHFVLGYEWMINENLRLKIEPYFQYLYNAPGIADSSWSMINFSQDWYFKDELKNNSIGKNVGIDFTFERFLNNNYYYLVTASVFNSEYRGDDGVWRNTRFNKSYVLNMLYGREFFLRRNKILGINGRINLMGGERYNPILLTESLNEKRVITDANKCFTKQYPASYYFDLTVSYRINKNKSSSVFALQIKNLLGSPMYSGYYYNLKTDNIDTYKDVVVFPVLSYKLEF